MAVHDIDFGDNKNVNKKDSSNISNNDNKKSPTREKVDNVFDGLASELLQKDGVPKKAADKAVKEDGGKFSPSNSPVSQAGKNYSRNKIANFIDNLNGNNNNNNGSGIRKPNNNIASPNNTKVDNPDNENFKKNNNFKNNLLNRDNQSKKNLKNKNNNSGSLPTKGKNLLKNSVKNLFNRGQEESDSSGDSNSNNEFEGSDVVKNGVNKIKNIILLIIKSNTLIIVFLLVFIAIIGVFVVSINLMVSEYGDMINVAFDMTNYFSTTAEASEGNEKYSELYSNVNSVKSETFNNRNLNYHLLIATLKTIMLYEPDYSYNSFSKEQILDIFGAMYNDNDQYDEDNFKVEIKDVLKKDFWPNISDEKLDDKVEEIMKNYYAMGYKFTASSSFSGSSYAYSSLDVEKFMKVVEDQLLDSNDSRLTGDKYQQFMHIGTTDAWCASFVSWCQNEAGISDKIMVQSAAVNEFYDFYTKANFFQTLDSGYIPKRGDLIIWKKGKNAKGWSHIGVVQSYDQATGKLYTIEGNSSNKVSRNRYNSLELSGCTGFATPFNSNFYGSSNAEIAWNFLISKGLSKETTAGILGNLQQESGIDPNKYQGKGGPGRGICQWEEGSGRFARLNDYASQMGSTWNDIKVQLEFLWFELTGGDSTTLSNLNNDYGGFDNFIHSSDIHWSCLAFEKSFERAGKPNMDNRYLYADQYYAQFGGK